MKASLIVIMAVSVSVDSHCTPEAAVTLISSPVFTSASLSDATVSRRAVNTNHRGDLSTISQHGGVGPDTCDSHRLHHR